MLIRVYALALGVLCHTSFLIGVGLMMVSLYFGMQLGMPLFQGYTAVLWDIFLIVQFPVIHSFFLSVRGQKLMQKLAPASVGSRLNTTFFGILASLQLILVFGAWQPSGFVWWEPEGFALYVLSFLYATGWLLLLKAMHEAGLGVQTGLIGWYAVFRGQNPKFRPFPRSGMHGSCRHPIYFCYAALLWFAPVWSLDRAALVLLWTAYCAYGPLFKERRYLRYAPEKYFAYRQRVPYFIPALRGRFWSSAEHA